MKKACALALCLTFCLTSAAMAVDDQKKSMVQAFAMDYPDQAISLTPLLLRGDTPAAVAAAARYLDGGTCDKAGYWLEQVKEGSLSEYEELKAIATFNGDCRDKNEQAALGLLQQCFASSLSCGRTLMQAAEMLDQGQTALEAARKLADFGDEDGLAELYYLTVNGKYTTADPARAYFLGLLAMRRASNPELRSVFVVTNESLAQKLTPAQREEILEKADAWSPAPLPDSVDNYSVTSSVYGLR